MMMWVWVWYEGGELWREATVDAECRLIAGDGGGRWTVPAAGGGRTDAMTMRCDGKYHLQDPVASLIWRFRDGSFM